MTQESDAKLIEDISNLIEAHQAAWGTGQRVAQVIIAVDLRAFREDGVTHEVGVYGSSMPIYQSIGLLDGATRRLVGND